MSELDTGAQKGVNERNLGEILLVLRRRIWVILGCVLLVAGAALVFSLIQTKQYSSTSSLLFRDPGFDQSLFGSQVFNSTDPSREAATNLNLVSLDAVAELTADDLGSGLTGDDVAGIVTVETEGASNVVSITALDPDPEFAARVANSFAESYVKFRRDADRSKIAGAIALVEREYRSLNPDQQESDEGQTLKKQVGRLQALGALQTGNAEIVQTAEAASSPTIPKTGRNVSLGILLGLLLGVAAALLMERFDRRIRDTPHLESVFSLPLLANIPESEALREGADATDVTHDLPTVDAESFRMLRTRLRYFNVDRKIKVVLATSAAPDDGKSTISWNLAAIAADTGGSAILVESDFRRPTAARRHNLAPSPGLAELLTHQTDLESAVQSVPVHAVTGSAQGATHLDVITSGSPPPSPADLLGSEEMKTLLKSLSETYDMVVIDAPPILVIADPIPLTGLVDGVIVVARLNKTTTDQAQNLRKQLENLGAPMLGVVANRVQGGNAYGYGYYAGVDAGSTRKEPKMSQSLS
ncbi:MAG TPA: polysaccharide biosynthesis tyrosine autokinase [Solirubrobacterales bacterium]|nr:polysaccharide biosynthesis tyrosine autokinase [Solirubrobacterales bacterium]